MSLENQKAIFEILVPILAILAGVWAAVRAIHKYYEKFLFFSGCHLITLSLKNALQTAHPKLSKELNDHAYQPFIILPRKLKRHLSIKDGTNVVLRFKLPDKDEIIVVAKAFWYPSDPELWDLFEQPSLSLTLRRYFGIERPSLGPDEKIPDGWRAIEHGTTRNNAPELAILHRTSAKNGKLIWLCDELFSSRFWLPERDGKGVKYRDDWADGWFLEYSGFALMVSKPSILSVTS